MQAKNVQLLFRFTLVLSVRCFMAIVTVYRVDSNASETCRDQLMNSARIRRIVHCTV